MTLEDRFRQQAEHCREAGSPLTAALLDGAAGDLAAGGVVAELLAPHVDAPAGSVPSLRYAGALHRLVLERRAPELALHYPSVGGTAPVDQVWPAAERATREHLDVLRELMTRTVQTNEVGRSAALYGALCLLDGPVRLLEIGASGGLNLRCDAFAYALADGRVLGDPVSPVRLEDPWRGALPEPREVEIVERHGCDPSPIDPTTTEGRLTLTSYVWGDQLPRLERLRGALDVSARVPATVERLGAMDFLSRELAEPVPGVTTVVWHSVVWQYVAPAERRAVDALFERLRHPVVRVSLEPQNGSYVFRVEARVWPSGERVHLADALGHGPPVEWTGATIPL